MIAAAAAIAGVAYLLEGPRETAGPAKDAPAPPASASGARERAAFASSSSSLSAVPMPPLAPARAPGRTIALPPINTPLAGMFAELKAAALSGDPNAACRLAFELQRCHALPREQAQVASLIDGARRPDASPEQVRALAIQAERQQARYKAEQKLCEGAPPQELGDGWRYLLQAARAGHGPSMLRYASGETLQGEDPFRILDGLVAYRTEGLGYLQRAAEMGYPEAYEQLSLAHSTGIDRGLGIPVDAVRGLAYTMALVRVASPGEAGRLQKGVTARIEQGKMSAEDVARAKALSEPLAERLLRRNAPGSVSFTGGTYGADNGSHCER